MTFSHDDFSLSDATEQSGFLEYGQNLPEPLHCSASGPLDDEDEEFEDFEEEDDDLEDDIEDDDLDDDDLEDDDDDYDEDDFDVDDED